MRNQVHLGHYQLNKISTNKTDRHDITEILLKVALNIMSLTIIKQTFYEEKHCKYLIQNIYIYLTVRYHDFFLINIIFYSTDND
jgi:hypothetical protein